MLADNQLPILPEDNEHEHDDGAADEPDDSHNEENEIDDSDKPAENDDTDEYGYLWSGDDMDEVYIQGEDQDFERDAWMEDELDTDQSSRVSDQDEEMNAIYANNDIDPIFDGNLGREEFDDDAWMWIKEPPNNPVDVEDNNAEEESAVKVKISVLDFCLRHKLTERTYHDLRTLLTNIDYQSVGALPQHFKTLRNFGEKKAMEPLIKVIYMHANILYLQLLSIIIADEM